MQHIPPHQNYDDIRTNQFDQLMHFYNWVMISATVIIYSERYDVYEHEVLDLIKVVAAIEKYQYRMLLKVSVVGLNLEQSTKITYWQEVLYEDI